MVPLPSVEEKLKIIREKNTFFTRASPEVEQKYQSWVEGIVSALKKWKGIIRKESKLDEKVLLKLLADFLHSEEYGFDAALTLSGLSNEKLFRIISFLRMAYAKGLYHSKSEWIKEEATGEWKAEAIKARLSDAPEFAFDVAKILLGKETSIVQRLSPFEQKCLKPDKFLFVEDAMLDALSRYSLHGSFSAAKGAAPEQVVKSCLDELGVFHTSGKVRGIGRRIDVIVPYKINPKVFIECSFVETTSSGMGDKAKTERDTVAKNIKQYYQKAVFILFVDGAGWLVREEAMRIMCEAADYVFTFHKEQLEEFKKLMGKLLSKEDYRPNLKRFFQSRQS